MTEDLEFRRMIWISSGFHITLIAGVLMASAVQKSMFLNPPDPLNNGVLNVMWATTVQSPPQTKENKLPGPIVPQVVEPASVKEESKVVMPEQLKGMKPGPKKLSPQEEKKEREAERKKAMLDAVASMQGKAEKRPIPRADNFPSIPGAETSKKGLPAGPLGGGLGAFAGDPVFQAYRSQVKQILSDNLIWVQRGSPQAQVTFRLDENGNVLDPKVSKSSGDPSFDNAALRAVRKSSPLPPPPPQFSQLLLGEDFTINFQPGRT